MRSVRSSSSPRARLVTNPAQVTQGADGYSVSGGFQGWTMAERLVLDQYRRKAG